MAVAELLREEGATRESGEFRVVLLEDIAVIAGKAR